MGLLRSGGVEGGFLWEPYASNPAFRGHAFWEPDDFEQVVEHAVGRAAGGVLLREDRSVGILAPGAFAGCGGVPY